MKELSKVLQPATFVVLGDLIVDEYRVGTVSRISPEAPVPVLEGVKRFCSPGGAANVAMNLAGLGNHVELVGVIGQDEAGCWLAEELRSHGVGTKGIFTDPASFTTVKCRFATTEQNLLRVDYEDGNQVGISMANAVSVYIEDYISGNRVDGFLVSNYNKGLMLQQDWENPLVSLVSRLNSESFIRGVDSKKIESGLRVFSGFDFIKPNLAELSKALNMQVSFPQLPDACNEYLRLTGARSVLVTLGNDGMYHHSDTQGIHVPAIDSSAHDVTGAGDTVFAVVTHALVNNSSWLDAMRLANIAAGLVVESRWTKAICREDLVKRVESIEKEHPSYLHAE